MTGDAGHIGALAYSGAMLILEVAYGEDDEQRLAGLPAHRERMQRLAAEGRVVVSGRWEDGSGALVVFSTDRADVEKILADDPYFSTPGVTVVSLRELLPSSGSAL